MGKRSVKAGATPGRLVGVVATRAALAAATRLRNPPDFFELRLDALCDWLNEAEQTIPRLPAPLIVTARHRAEGGTNELSEGARRELLLRFLEHAAFVDVELRSVRHFQPVVKKARHRKIGLIISCHDFRDTPSSAELNRKAKAAATCGADIFKIVTRTDTLAQFARLLGFFKERNSAALPIAAMGIGKFGAEARRRFAHLGSALIYAHLGVANAEGQPSLRQLLRARRAYTI